MRVGGVIHSSMMLLALFDPTRLLNKIGREMIAVMMIWQMTVIVVVGGTALATASTASVARAKGPILTLRMWTLAVIVHKSATKRI